MKSGDSEEKYFEEIEKKVDEIMKIVERMKADKIPAEPGKTRMLLLIFRNEKVLHAGVRGALQNIVEGVIDGMEGVSQLVPLVEVLFQALAYRKLQCPANIQLPPIPSRDNPLLN